MCQQQGRISIYLSNKGVYTMQIDRRSTFVGDLSVDPPVLRANDDFLSPLLAVSQTQLLSHFWRRTMPTLTEPPEAQGKRGEGELRAMLYHQSSPSLNDQGPRQGPGQGGLGPLSPHAPAFTSVVIGDAVGGAVDAAGGPGLQAGAAPGAPIHGEVCLLTESPYRILRVSVLCMRSCMRGMQARVGLGKRIVRIGLKT